MPFEPFAVGDGGPLPSEFAAKAADVPATGSPSAASATVSATTIAGAVERVDERDRRFDLSGAMPEFG